MHPSHFPFFILFNLKLLKNWLPVGEIRNVQYPLCTVDETTHLGFRRLFESTVSAISLLKHGCPAVGELIYRNMMERECSPTRPDEDGQIGVVRGRHWLNDGARVPRVEDKYKSWLSIKLERSWSARMMTCTLPARSHGTELLQQPDFFSIPPWVQGYRS